jgi:glycosyltransferase involved in cell wall biosynthesis
MPATDVAAEPRGLGDLPTFDAVFYNLGNDASEHAWIFDIARLHPGIVVLHDGTMHQFFADYYLHHLRRPDLYIRRMAEHYGISGLRTAERALGPWFDAERVAVAVDDDDLTRCTFTEEVLRSARGAVVHSGGHARFVESVWSGPVCATWLPAQRPSASAVAGGTRRDERGRRRATLMTLDAVDPSSHVIDVIDVLAEDAALAARTRYVIAGWCDVADPYVAALKTAIAERGLDEAVRLLGDLRPTDIDEWARHTDVFVNLRYPDDAGRSTSLMYQLPFGKPVVAYDVGSIVEVPNEALVKVRVGDKAALRRNLRELADNLARRQAIGAAAKHFADRHPTREYARELLRFAEQDACPAGAEPLAQAAAHAIAERIGTGIGETLASLGAIPSSPGVDTVIREAARLLWPPSGSPRL